MSTSKIRAALIKSELIQAKATFLNFLGTDQGSNWSWLQIQADCLSLLHGFIFCHGPAIHATNLLRLQHDCSPN